MRATAGGSVGPRGIALLVVTGAVGLALGVHGWSARGSGATPDAFASMPSSQQVARPHTSPTASPSPRATHHTTTHTSAGAAGGGPGPLLSAQGYASYSFKVWPGTPTPAARAAMTGLSISVHRTASGISVSAGVRGQPSPAPRSFTHGARVYVIEASMGDEAGSADYNLGDDGLVVTDAHGRIVR